MKLHTATTFHKPIELEDALSALNDIVAAISVDNALVPDLENIPTSSAEAIQGRLTDIIHQYRYERLVKSIPSPTKDSTPDQLRLYQSVTAPYKSSVGNAWIISIYLFKCCSHSTGVSDQCHQRSSPGQVVYIAAYPFFNLSFTLITSIDREI